MVNISFSENSRNFHLSNTAWPQTVGTAGKHIPGGDKDLDLPSGACCPEAGGRQGMESGPGVAKLGGLAGWSMWPGQGETFPGCLEFNLEFRSGSLSPITFSCSYNAVLCRIKLYSKGRDYIFQPPGKKKKHAISGMSLEICKQGVGVLLSILLGCPLQSPA